MRVEAVGQVFEVETGFVVYNERTYPLFSRLLDELGVATKPTEMSFSVTCERTGLAYNGGSLDGLFAQRRNLLRPSFLGMLRDALRFYREAPALLEAPDPKLSLGEWLGGRGYGGAFVEQHLMPMGAAIWSCEPERIADFPAVAFARYVERLCSDFRGAIRLRESVRAVRRETDRVPQRRSAQRTFASCISKT